MRLEPEFVSRIMAVFGEVGHAWLTELPNLANRLADAWQIKVGEILPNLSYSYVAGVTRADGTRAVLKLQPPNKEFEPQFKALQAFTAAASARLLEYSKADCALLLERLEPGDDLTSLRDEEATRIAASVMRRLWTMPPTYSFPTIETWSKGFDRYLQNNRAGGPLPSSEVEAARDAYLDLISTSAEPILLHGDLHHYNILRSGDTWKAIDPKGVIGEPAYEAGALLRNPATLLDWPGALDRTSRRLDILAQELQLDRERIKRWAYAQAILSACWMVEDNEPHGDRSLRIAHLLRAA